MQLRQVLISLIFALCCADAVIGRRVPARRQATTSTSIDSSIASTARSPSSTAKSSAGSDGKGAHVSSTKVHAAKANSKSPSAATSKHVAHTPTTTSNATGTHTAAPKREQLPIEPIITPALGILGVILIISGVAFTVIAIQHQWLLVSFSTAYLVSLSVTVLVVYVMSPPVSNAVQGGYVVAAVVTGLIFGALALIFKDVTEGLGCLLGGFCLSMWFLVLRPGGLIESQTGRAIMIGVFCAVGWSLAFSSKTREKGLLFCTAFAGATVTVLGIDCFSCAGLKEFWIYISGLNNEDFPIGTKTYPITRGIRVEIAAIIVLAAFGVLSQFRIWKVVKDHRRKKDEKRTEEAQRREERDLAAGRRVEGRNQRDLSQWEAAYGDGDYTPVHTDSGVGGPVESLPKKSVNVKEREITDIEMDDMPGMSGRRSSKDPRRAMMVRVAEDDAIMDESSERLPLQSDNSDLWRGKRQKASSSSIDQQHRSAFPGGPALILLQSSPPVDRDDEEVINDETIASDVSAENRKSVNERRGVSLDKLGLNNLDVLAPHSIPRIDEDGASSVAATAADNDHMSANLLSATPSPYQLDLNEGGLSPFAEGFRNLSRASSTPGTPGEPAIDENDDEELVRPTTAREDPRALTRNSTLRRRKSSSASDQNSAAIEAATFDQETPEVPDDQVSVVHSLKGRLPERMSKAAMVHRTNEWTKYTGDADEPDSADLLDDDEPGVRVEVGRPQEVPRQVNPEALIETSPPANPAFVQRQSVRRSTNPYRRSSDGPVSSRQASGGAPIPVYASQASMDRQRSNSSLNQSKRPMRVSTGHPSYGSLVASPVEDVLAASGPYRRASSGPLVSTNNLLDNRVHRLNNKLTTTSFNALNFAGPSNAASNVGEPEGDNISLSSRKQRLDEDNMSLAERKSLISQGVLQPASSPGEQTYGPRNRTVSQPQPNSMGRASNSNAIYDPHQPKRSNTVDNVKQNEKLRQWRESLQQGSSARPSMMAEEEARLAMITNQRRSHQWTSLQQQQQATRLNVIDLAMRTGQMKSAHQDALRRLQAQANRSAREH